MASDGERLYTLSDVSRELGLVFSSIRGRWERGSCPPPDFYHPLSGSRIKPLWTAESLELWRALIPDAGDKVRQRSKSLEEVPEWFSDHKAVNKVGRVTITWRLWWRRADAHSPVIWWFSTPRGWHTSADNGRTWMNTGEMTRPAGHYRLPGGGGAAVAARRGAQALRNRMEKCAKAS